LLKQADRVPITLIQVPDSGFLVRRGEGDGGRARWQAPAYRNTGDDRGKVSLFKINDRGFVVRGSDTSLLTGHRLGQIAGTKQPESPDTASNQQE
jgi:hypothetical protein